MQEILTAIITIKHQDTKFNKLYMSRFSEWSEIYL